MQRNFVKQSLKISQSKSFIIINCRRFIHCCNFQIKVTNYLFLIQREFYYRKSCNTVHSFAVSFANFTTSKIYEIVRVPEKPFKRYWVVKVYDSALPNREIFTVIVPSWCQPDLLTCKFPPDLVVCSKVKARVVSMKPAASDWISYDYIFFSQTGKHELQFLHLCNA